MSQIFDSTGKVTPVTVIEAGPCFVVQMKNEESDGYNSVQLGFEKLKESKIKKSKKSKPYKIIKEFKIEESAMKDLEIGSEVKVDAFEEGDKVKIAGQSKGKGFQGVVKRHGFSGGPASHGHRHVLRTPGSVGSAFPQRVIKGRKMAGHAGADRVTTTGLEIIKVDSKNNLLLVRGAVPGPNKGILEIRSQVLC